MEEELTKENLEQEISKPKRQTTKNIAKCTIFVFVVLLFVLCMSVVFCHPTFYCLYTYALFKNEPKNSIDVVMFGPSTAYHAFIPTYAYQKYGFTSYNYCGNHQNINITQLGVQEVLKTQKPKVLIIDLFFVTYGHEYENNTWDWYISQDVADRPKLITKLGKSKDINYYLPVLNYHAQWGQVSWYATTASKYYYKLSNKPTTLKGFSTSTNMLTDSGKQFVSYDDQTLPLRDYDNKNFKNLLEYLCTLKDISVVFTCIPRLDSSQTDYKYVNTAINMINQKMAEHPNLKYISFKEQFDSDPNLVSYFSDNDHMNVYGAEKFTTLMGEYITNNITNTFEHSQVTTSSWQQWAKQGQEFINNAKKYIEQKRCFVYSELNYMFPNLNAKF